MTNTHDDDFAARLEAIRRKPHWARTDADWDDIESEAQIATLDRLVAERKKEGLPPPTPSVPKRSLVQACLECGFIDARWERRMLTSFEADLQQAAAEINATTKH